MTLFDEVFSRDPSQPRPSLKENDKSILAYLVLMGQRFIVRNGSSDQWVFSKTLHVDWSSPTALPYVRHPERLSLLAKEKFLLHIVFPGEAYRLIPGGTAEGKLILRELRSS